jgi:DNA-binding response OmpR family regulator
MRVLLIEDDRMIGESLTHALRASGDAVDWVQDGEDGEHAARDAGYAAVLLDLRLPGKPGLDVLRRMRQEGNGVPVMILSARDTVADRVSGLDLGADDYVVKPFDVYELQARLRAIVRRNVGRASPILTNGEIELDPSTHEAAYRGQTAMLPAREFALLHALLDRPGSVLSRAQLEERIYGWNEEVESNTVEVLIHYLRKRFGQDIIRNVRGVGWMVARSQ